MVEKVGAKPSEVPCVCVCGAAPVYVKAKKLGIGYFCPDCLLRSLWCRGEIQAIKSWNTEIEKARYLRKHLPVEDQPGDPV